MMKTLIIAAHPHLEESQINSRWLKELKRYPDEFTVHSLYDVYPDHVLDIQREQALLAAHDRIVLQFPVYWFSSPPLLKQWLDEVLLEGWAYGTEINIFENKTISVAVSAGSHEHHYQPDGKYGFDIHSILSPFQVTVRYLNAHYRQPFVLFSAGSRLSDEQIEQSAHEYVEYLLQQDDVCLITS